jgi:hypothetical protein
MNNITNAVKNSIIPEAMRILLFTLTDVLSEFILVAFINKI